MPRDRLQHVLERGLSHLRLVIGSRSEPPIGLHRLRLNDDLCELREADLRLDLDETSELISRLGLDPVLIDVAATPRSHRGLGRRGPAGRAVGHRQRRPCGNGSCPERQQPGDRHLSHRGSRGSPAAADPPVSRGHLRGRRARSAVVRGADGRFECRSRRRHPYVARGRGRSTCSCREPTRPARCSAITTCSVSCCATSCVCGSRRHFAHQTPDRGRHLHAIG